MNISTSQERILKGFLNYLINSSIHITNYKSLKAEYEKASLEESAYVQECSVLTSEISELISSHRSRFSTLHFPEIEKGVMEYVNKAMASAGEKLKEEYSEKTHELKRKMDLEKNSCLNGIMEFLALRLLKELDTNIILKLNDKNYDVIANYQVENEIECSFKLDPKGQDLFALPLRFSSLEKGVRIPLREPIITDGKESEAHFEKIDRYVLTEAIIKGGSLLAIFSSQEGNSRVEFTMSKGDLANFVAIKFFDGQNNIDITGTKGLSEIMDIEKVQEPLDRIYGTMLELENNRIELIHLNMGNKDIIECMDYSTFILRLFEIKKNDIRDAINSAHNAGGMYGKAEIEQALARCGDNAGDLRRLLGF